MSADHPNATNQPGYGSTPAYQGATDAPPTFAEDASQHGGIHDTQVIGTSVIVTYADGTTRVVPKDAFGTSTSSNAATGGQYLQNQQAQNSLAETIRQFNEQMGMDKARGDQQQRLSQQLADQKAASDNQNYQLALQRFGLDQQSQGLAQQTQDFKQYSDLANLASNPRNYVQSFFMHRGYTPPADVARYGNTQQNASQIMPFSQWQAQRQPQGGPVGGPSSWTPPSPGYGPVPMPMLGQGPSNHSTPTTADTAMINGVKTWAGGAYSGKPVDQSPANAGDLTPYLKDPNLPDPTGRVQVQPKMFARGGSVTMYVPHALVNLATGRTVAIAGEAGKETAQFDGAALIDPFYDTSGGPVLDPGSSIPLMNDPAVPTTPGATTPFGTMGPTPGATPTSTPTSTPAPSTPQPTATPAPTLTADLVAQARALAAQANSALPAGAVGGSTPAQQAQAAAPATASPPPPAPISGANPPTLTDMITPGTPGGPASYGQPIPQQMPTYLSGENFTASSPVTDAVRNLPFMKRLYGQARGDQAYGTNTTQQTNLPPDLPLLSHQAWVQLAPSEQEAFLSYVSSLGVDPKDYLNMIAQSSPQGGYASSPNFGSNFAYSRQ